MITLVRRLPHPIERVWRALDDPEELAAWMPGPGEVIEHDEPSRIAWSAHGHTVRIELAPDGDDATRLTFTHQLPEGEPARFAAGWETYLNRLDGLLAGVRIDEQEAHDERRLVLCDGPELRLRRRFFVGVDRLWRALTETDELAHWFPDAMEVVESDAPHRLVARWHDSTLTLELAPDGEATWLTFVHAFDDRDQAALTAAGWDRCFARLEALVSGAPMDERASLELWPHVHERYAEAFGVDPAIGQRVYEEHLAS